MVKWIEFVDTRKPSQLFYISMKKLALFWVKNKPFIMIQKKSHINLLLNRKKEFFITLKILVLQALTLCNNFLHLKWGRVIYQRKKTVANEIRPSVFASVPQSVFVVASSSIM